jgi:hypothetical protein
MPKVTKEFKLPEEQTEFEISNNASGYLSVIWDLDQMLRNKIKHEDAGEDYQTIRDYLWELIRDAGVDINL